MHLVPVGFRNTPVGHLAICSGITTISSNSVATAGSGYVRIPVRALIMASVGGLFACYNGTAGSVLFNGRATAGGVLEFDFWENPGNLATGKPLVIETTGEVGISNFHVYYIVARAGAGPGVLVQ